MFCDAGVTSFRTVHSFGGQAGDIVADGFGWIGFAEKTENSKTDFLRMSEMKRKSIFVLAVLMLVWATGAQAITIDYVTVGNAGNANDDTGYGSVSEVYQIGKYEVTAGQYTEFLNAVAATDTYGLYNTSMWSSSYGCKIQQSSSSGSYSYSVAADYANRPVNYVDWYDTLRFSNWLHNGQPTGAQNSSTTEDGAYDMSLGSSVVRKASATVWLPSEDEWYKTAYHKNDGVTGNYFDYPTSNDSVPSNDLVEPTDPGNNATFFDGADYTIGSPYYRTEVGAHENSDSPYGTFDMGGNVWEWNETLTFGSYRGCRGGTYGSDSGGLRSVYRGYNDPDYEYYTVGFRVASVPGPTTFYVDDDAAGNNDGSSWSNAYTYLQDALAYAESNGDINEIRVAQGIYKPDQNSVNPNGTGNREATFQLVNGVTLKGGYAGFGEPNPNTRDFELYETVLSGDLEGDDAEFPYYPPSYPSRADNSYHVVDGSNTDSSAICDGFWIIRGNANNTNPNDSGGGIYIYNGTPTITNITITKNSAGNDLDDGGGGGGGIYAWSQSPESLTLTNCTFSENMYMDDWPVGGGGGAFLACNTVLDQCVFVGNVLTHANTNYTGGGGLYVPAGTSVIKNCKFIDNYSNRYGGAFWGDGTITLIDSTFINNNSHEGGAIHINNSDSLIKNCLFIENVASRGGAFSQWSFDNTGTSLGGCTFSKNSASAYGGAIYGMQNGKVTLTNCILWGNTAGLNGNEIGFSESACTITVKYSNVDGGELGVHLGGGTVDWLEGNIDINPCFVDADSNDFHLLPDSPCIDAGDPNYVAGPNETDLDGNPRVVDGDNDGNTVVDMGAYEYNPFVVSFVVDNRERRSRTIFRYTCRVTMDNLSPGAVENVQLELVGVPDNMSIVDPCVTFVYIEAWGSATSEDTCIIDVNRIEPITPAEIVWRIAYEIAGSGEGMQQMSSTVVLLEPEGLASGDITGEGVVDIDDLARMADDWLESGSLADIYPAPPYGDDIVNFQDFAVLAENWLWGK